MIIQTIQKHLEANGIHTSIISPDLTTTRLHLHRNTYDFYRRHYIVHDHQAQPRQTHPKPKRPRTPRQNNRLGQPHMQHLLQAIHQALNQAGYQNRYREDTIFLVNQLAHIKLENNQITIYQPNTHDIRKWAEDTTTRYSPSDPQLIPKIIQDLQ